jgi:hypothetical protein
MWTSLFALLGKGIDLARDLFSSRKAPPIELSPQVAGSEDQEVGRASGKAAYEASKSVGPGRAKP